MKRNFKKIIGLVVIGLMVSAILYSIFQFFTREPDVISPIPEDEGIKVIFITPEVTPAE